MCKNKILSLPFDQYQRYKAIQLIIERLRDKKRLKILEAGGIPGQILNFLPVDDIIIVDKKTEATDTPFISADACNLPFPDNYFDISLSVDVFEHIPETDRENFIAELARVTNRSLILAAPFDTSSVSLYETIANNFFKAITGNNNIWLQEHREQGLPDLNKTISLVKRYFPYVEILSNGYLPRWIKMIPYQLSFWDDGTIGPYLSSIHEFYNRSFFEYDNKPDSYRKIIIASSRRRSFPLPEKKEDATSKQNELLLDSLLENVRLLYTKKTIASIKGERGTPVSPDSFYQSPLFLNAAAALPVRIQPSCARFILYGAGTHTIELLKHLAQDSLFPTAIVNSSKENIPDRRLPCVAMIDSIDIERIDYIIVSSYTFQNQMIKKLLKNKIPAEKIISLY